MANRPDPVRDEYRLTAYNALTDRGGGAPEAFAFAYLASALNNYDLETCRAMRDGLENAIALGRDNAEQRRTHRPLTPPATG